ncbi:SCO family protein [Uliginosibacterium sp. H1]|uniref:SCO family protein n=1 Tax=Uliginosibacterium sp. H1 TaxID=3114757 RepID=UPI002E1901CB|nr:hypothetical protein [Uliginosibacterium sp. H1]
MQRRRARRTLLLIFLVAAAPIIAAYLAFFFWKPAAGANYGELVQPPRALDVGQFHTLHAAASGQPADAPALRGHWLLAYVGPGACDAACVQNVYYTRQVRLAQNKEVDRVQRVWLVTDGAAPQVAALDDAPLVAHVGDSLAGEAGRIVLIDPQGNLMMRFPADADPKRMIKDLQRLLKYSRAG